MLTVYNEQIIEHHRLNHTPLQTQFSLCTMKYQSTFSHACALLSLLTSAAASSRNNGVSGGTWSSGGDSVHNNPSSSTTTTNDYLESTLRRLQARLITDRRGRSKSCRIDGIENCASTYYYYKDFEDGGITFAEAHAATGTAADLEGCVLAPIYSYEDLVEISDVIPPCKAAYTAAYKDPVQVFREAKECELNGNIAYNCDFATLGDTLDKLWGGADAGSFGVCSLEDWFGDDFTNGEVWCPALKQNWYNYGSSEAIPSNAWRAGDSHYCGDGPIHNAAAAFATDYSTEDPTAVLKALNSGEYLNGAVYKCCQQDEVTCYNEKE